MKYAKAFVASTIAGLGSLLTALGDNAVSGQEAITIAIVTLTALGGVWGITNKASSELFT